MSEWRLFDGEVPFVGTLEFFSQQPRAPHLEQPVHRERLMAAAVLVRQARAEGAATFSDLGCGDGGLLSVVQDDFDQAWGYDLQPSNRAGWPERGVTAEWLDIFGADRDKVRFGQLSAMTEVLEHIGDPHGVLGWVRQNSEYLVCSSPCNENDRVHGPEHAWAWDTAGYAEMITAAGWTIQSHEVGVYNLFQFVLAHA